MRRAKYVFLNGELTPWDDATVHIGAVGFKFGAGVFEGVRGYWNESDQQMYLFRMEDHMRRLRHSQAFMRFDEIIDGDYVKEKTIELIRANELRNTVHIMTTVFVTGPGSPMVCGPVDLAITAAPLLQESLVSKGCSVQVSSWQRISDNAMPARIKCNANYQNGRIAGLQAKADGYDTALMMNSRGKIAEGPGMCFFMVRDGKVITPPTSSDILESITRETVMELIPKRCGLEMIEREIDRTELVSAQEAFFCGTAWEVTPVTSIDRLPIGEGEVGPIVKQLQDIYFKISLGETEEYAHWRTPVY